LIGGALAFKAAGINLSGLNNGRDYSDVAVLRREIVLGTDIEEAEAQMTSFGYKKSGCPKDTPLSEGKPVCFYKSECLPGEWNKISMRITFDQNNKVAAINGGIVLSKFDVGCPDDE
jgi:hypothetical protein